MSDVVVTALGVLRVAAIGSTAVAVVLGTMTLPAHLLAPGSPTQSYWAFNLVVAIMFGLAGLAIALGRPRNPIGWVFISGVLGNGLTGAASNAGVVLHSSFLLWLGSWSWIALPVAIVLTVLLFPEGRPASAASRAAPPSERSTTSGSSTANSKACQLPLCPPFDHFRHHSATTEW